MDPPISSSQHACGQLLLKALQQSSGVELREVEQLCQSHSRGWKGSGRGLASRAHANSGPGGRVPSPPGPGPYSASSWSCICSLGAAGTWPRPLDSDRSRAAWAPAWLITLSQPHAEKSWNMHRSISMESCPLRFHTTEL